MPKLDNGKIRPSAACLASSLVAFSLDPRLADVRGRPCRALRVTVVPSCLLVHRGPLTLRGNILHTCIFMICDCATALVNSFSLKGFISLKQEPVTLISLFGETAYLSHGKGHGGSHQDARNESRRSMEGSNQIPAN